MRLLCPCLGGDAATHQHVGPNHRVVDDELDADGLARGERMQPLGPVDEADEAVGEAVMTLAKPGRRGARR